MNLRFTLLLLLVSAIASAQNLNQKLSKAFAAFEADSQLKYAISSLTVLDGNTGEVVYSKNENIGLASASTLKTVTAATAYYLLGPEFNWETTIAYSGEISNGVLEGDLHIVGGGDPTLGSWRYPSTKKETIFNNWVTAIQRAGIKKVEGRIIGDDRLFGSQTLPVGWTWQDMGNYYGAGPNSLTWHENQFDLHFQPGKSVGSPVKLLKVDPALTGVQIVNEVTTGAPGSGDNVYVYSAPYSEVIYLRGTYGIDLKKIISGSVPDPAFQIASELGDFLQEKGIGFIEVSTSRRLAMQGTTVPVLSTVLATHVSPSLAQANYWFNQKSINLYGEHFLKTIAWKKGQEISTGEGVQLLQDFWKDKCGIEPAEINIMDGSGLSPGNRITTSAMASILQTIKRESWFASFYEGLPVINNMKMKSGTINDVLAYTGYQTTSVGQPLVFSFIVNNYSGRASGVRQKMFKVLDELK